MAFSLFNVHYILVGDWREQNCCVYRNFLNGESSYDYEYNDSGSFITLIQSIIDASKIGCDFKINVMSG